jgi:hypothetical protein
VAGLLARIQDLKAKHGGGVDDFEPVRATLLVKPASFAKTRSRG